MPTKTPTQLRTEADEMGALAAQLEEKARLARQAEGALREMAEFEERALTGMGTKGTLGTEDMEANSPSAGANISAAKTKSRLPFPRALHKRNLSVPEWARAQRKPSVEVETARAWTKKPDRGGRKIPRAWADRIAAEFKDENGKSEVPAVKASWPSGIRED